MEHHLALCQSECPSVLRVVLSSGTFSSKLLLYQRGRTGKRVPVGHDKIGETDIGAYHYDVFVFPGSTTMVTWSATTEPPHRFVWVFDKPQEDLLDPNFDDVRKVVILLQSTHGMVSHIFISIWAAEAAERAKEGTVDAYVRDIGRMIEWADLGPAK
ncbi:hypothetical protein [Tranquillimonas alkanivorans]|uniref:hypothetical protein n=1 Tax=Tranquillimonas alkanivorans TaxID=441119 RepID=UPI0011603785|nr:hypothetical protein [Tranquillimonas alkanivorans]